jgi:hypothetical protein
MPVLDVDLSLPTVVFPTKLSCLLNQPKAFSSNKGSHFVSLPVGLPVIVKIMAKN